MFRRKNNYISGGFWHHTRL